ncbi:transglutaminase-like domain-containing protein [Thermococcus sp. SY098]|uniref:transglutaminase-like domain-containing protein n=1 Tax=Thermococcus sp. SY098 TaxID=3111325 RepID=UPI002D780BA3|nr:transglutaminase-like domain-containing protein [Thermococcus sp. SY098]WRS53314.1 transglutaminase-like domain-containing protein [Thermococcus sp. SY098]
MKLLKFMLSVLIIALVFVSGCVQIETITQTEKATSETLSTHSSTATPFTRTTSSTAVLPQVNTTSSCSDPLWRYVLERAIPCALSKEELAKIKPLAEQLKGDSLQQSAWNILEWEKEHIQYDWKKASLPAPEIEIYSNGSFKVVRGKDNTIQTPYETIMKGKGICTDYAILTAGLLLDMNYSPVYIFSINFTNSDIGHAAAVIKIDGWYFVLDQHPPAMDLGAYYRYWKEKGKTISNATIYEIKLVNGSAEVKNLGIVSGIEFLKQDYKFTDSDAQAISGSLSSIILKNFPNLRLDEKLQSLSQGTLPRGYSEGKVWTFRFEKFVEYYNPLFHEQLIEYLYDSIVSDPEVGADLEQYSAFWIEIREEGENLKIILDIAKS